MKGLIYRGEPDLIMSNVRNPLEQSHPLIDQNSLEEAFVKWRQHVESHL